MASAFVDSIGVATYLHYDDTVYANYYAIIEPQLLELGVRHVADDSYTYPGPAEARSSTVLSVT